MVKIIENQSKIGSIVIIRTLLRRRLLMFAELHTGTRAVLCTMYPSNAHSAGFVILPPQRIDNPIHISPKYETNCEAWYLFGCKFSV